MSAANNNNNKPEYKEEEVKFDAVSLDTTRRLLRRASSPLKNEGVEYLNWLVIGNAGVGKTSLLNSLITALTGDGFVKKRFLEHGGGDHGTVSFDWRELDRVGVDSLKACKFRFMDLWGATSGNFKTDEAALIMNGQLYDGFKNTDNAVFGQNEKHLDPSLSTAPHGILLVIDIHNYDDDAIYNFYEKFADRARQTMVPIVAVITKIDDSNELRFLEHDPQKAYCNDNLASRRKTVASKADGLELGDVFLVKNYKQEQHAQPKVDSLLLRLAEVLFVRSVEYLKMVGIGSIKHYAGSSKNPIGGAASSSSATSSSSSSSGSVSLVELMSICSEVDGIDMDNIHSRTECIQALTECLDRKEIPLIKLSNLCDRLRIDVTELENEEQMAREILAKLQS